MSAVIHAHQQVQFLKNCVVLNNQNKSYFNFFKQISALKHRSEMPC
jgi:hypothetical protein